MDKHCLEGNDKPPSKTLAKKLLRQHQHSLKSMVHNYHHRKIIYPADIPRGICGVSSAHLVTY